MNLLGTHDTERILTCLGVSGNEITEFMPPAKAKFRLTDEEYAKGVKRLKMAAAIQYTVYGVPSLYYGDEAGMEGFGDPFCRMPYPWGRENEELLEHYRALGKMRENEEVFADGSFKAEILSLGAIKLTREKGKGEIMTLATRENFDLSVKLDGIYKDLLSGDTYNGEITLSPDTAVVLKRIK